MNEKPIKWFLDKESKIPLYLQLKDLIKYYISTGVIQDNTVLPGVNSLAKDLGINFETVRKAYKELEKEGLISMSRGKKTAATLSQASTTKLRPSLPIDLDPEESLVNALKVFLRAGRGPAEARKILGRIIREVADEKSRKVLVFTECNPLQVKEISDLLRKNLAISVKATLLDELDRVLDELEKKSQSVVAVVTTGFHINEVRSILGGRPLDVQVLITNMSPETRQTLAAFGPGAKIGFICRDQESIMLYKDLLRAELGEGIKLISTSVNDRDAVRKILKEADVCLVTPPVYEEIKTIAPRRLPILNVFDRVDPMSLRLIKERILSTP